MRSCYPQWLKYLLLHWGASPLLTTNHRVPFSDVSFKLWGSLRLVIAYCTLLGLRSSSCHVYAPINYAFNPYLPCPDSLCPKGWAACVLWTLDSQWLYNCCRGNRLLLVQIQGLKVQSKQTGAAVNDAFHPHPSSILPPGAQGSNPTCNYFSVSPLSA